MSVGEVFLGAFVQVLLQNLHSLIATKITLSNELEADLRTFKKSLEVIREVLGDAEQSQVRKHDVKSWLCQLRDVAYDANDVVDEISTESCRRSSVHWRPVRNALADVNPKRLSFNNNIAGRVKRIIETIDGIRNRSTLGLRPAEGVGRPGRADDQDVDKPTTGILSSEVPIFGREHDTNNIVELLTTDEYSSKHISVIPIQGIGGIGKTALAQVVYNHANVSYHFDRKMWVYVPYGSDVTRLTKLILESIAGRPTSLLELNNLQHELMSWLSGTKYLLVLDNMWSERSEDWNGLSEDWVELQKPLLHGARGSRILITTRSPTTAKTTSTIGRPLLLHGLPYEACLAVFVHYASEDPSECAKLGKLAIIGKEIVKKCCGSPMAARTLGSHLRAADRKKWEHFATSEILHLPESRDGILRSLESTYHQLPPHLKQCFRFCGIFPKNFKFEKNVLVRLWMAQGFILPTALQGTHVQRLEDIGAQYFDSLVDRLFFRCADDDPSRYVMYDLISELARFISHDECYMFPHNKPCQVLETIRHSSIFCDHSNEEASSSSSPPNQQPTIQSFYKTKGLYTLLLIGDFRHCSMQIPNGMGEILSRLRTLDLGNLNIEMLDDSIAEMIHLRYLNLSSTRIRCLPESVCRLYNLQTLGLRNCSWLEKLPKNIKYLSNLRHLDLHLDDDFHRETVMNVLRYMPRGIGMLNLQTLTRFAVGKEWNCGGVKELGKLNGIHGDLRLLNLHNINHEPEAKDAKLSDKEYLKRLELQWDDNYSSKQHNRTQEILVLENLRPHTNLTELWIVGYSGTSFPSWICDDSFSNLVKVKLSNCGKCKKLPPLGLLPSLGELCITGMDGVEKVTCTEFCGLSNVHIGFRSLRKLQFENMRNWKEWNGVETCRLPSLRELVIKDCPCLGSTAIHSFPIETQVFLYNTSSHQ